MSMEPQRTCPSCGNVLSGAVEFCPVCMLRKAFAGGVESGESAFEEAVKPTLQNAAQRFEHYELVAGEDGKPVELGRGAMGVTYNYKAFDVDLRYPVTLKVINEKYLADESARLRFLREARAAASVRHPNVASVFHLGRTGQNYFYAMEFVEGETLENLIKRSGRLEVNLAVEIATQVAAGLDAVHKKKLVHRDVKPSNIMVSLEDGGAVRAKIIDLGLAKAVNDPGSQIAISIPGGFAGTPEFASPEQFAGVGVDIRSDLYSLGVMLWEMVTGHALFKGSPAEVMYQHQHVPLPLERLKGVAPPFVVLIEVLLENILGARGALLSILVHFFEHGRWGSLLETGAEGQSLTAEDQLFILMQAALYLTATRGLGAPDVQICYERAESLCHSLTRPLLLYSALKGQWNYSLMTDKLTAAMQIAKRVYSLAQEQNAPALWISANRTLACTSYFLGDFESVRRYAMRALQIWHSGGVQSPVEEVDPPVVACLCDKAQSEWHFGEIDSSHATMAEAIALAKVLNVFRLPLC